MEKDTKNEALQEIKPRPTIIPTVGRMVYFKSRGSADEIFPSRDFAAIITRVYTDTCISVVSFSEGGLRFEEQVEQGQERGQWDWMPFQKDQQLRVGYGNIGTCCTPPKTE